MYHGGSQRAGTGGNVVLLKFGVLGLLVERRGYGYELVQRLGDRLGNAWQLNPSAVYAALDQLEGDRHICRVGCGGQKPPLAPADASDDPGQLGARRARSSRRSERIVYEATDLGESEFQRWLARPTARVAPIRSEIQLKVALAGPENVPPLLSSIAQEEWVVRLMHQECTAESSRLAGESTGPLEPGADVWAHTASALLNAAAARQLESQLQWIETVRETLQELMAAQLGLDRPHSDKRRSSVAGR